MTKTDTLIDTMIKKQNSHYTIHQKNKTIIFPNHDFKIAFKYITNKNQTEEKNYTFYDLIEKNIKSIVEIKIYQCIIENPRDIIKNIEDKTNFIKELYREIGRIHFIKNKEQEFIRFTLEDFYFECHNEEKIKSKSKIWNYQTKNYDIFKDILQFIEKNPQKTINISQFSEIDRNKSNKKTKEIGNFLIQDPTLDPIVKILFKFRLKNNSMIMVDIQHEGKTQFIMQINPRDPALRNKIIEKIITIIAENTAHDQIEVLQKIENIQSKHIAQQIIDLQSYEKNIFNPVLYEEFLNNQ